MNSVSSRDLLSCDKEKIDIFSKYFERMIIGSTFVFLDIEKLSDKNKLKYVRSIFDMPKDIELCDSIAYVWINVVFEYDIENIISYVKFFKEMGCKFCWHHLQKKFMKIFENEELRLCYNEEIFKDLHSTIYSRKHNFGCVCGSGKIKYYGLLETLVINSRGINIDSFISCGGITYEEHLSYIDSQINDLILWKVPFVDDDESYYPISDFDEILRDAYKSKNLDDKVEQIIDRVKRQIELWK